MWNDILNFLSSTGIAKLIEDPNWWQYLVMYAIVGVLFYLAIVKKFEPLLLLPIAFGMLLANLPAANLIHLDFFFDEFYIGFDAYNNPSGTLAYEMSEFLAQLDTLSQYLDIPKLYSIKDGICTFDFSLLEGRIVQLSQTVSYDAKEYVQLVFDQMLGQNVSFDIMKDTSMHIKMSTVIKQVINDGGLVDILYLGVKLGIYPSLIFLGVGAMTDFSPLIANPKSLLMGAGAQLGVFVAFFAALFLGFTPMEAGAIGIIGGADGPTAILITKELAPHLLGAIAIAAYSYMALIPIIQPPFMRLLTTEKERKIRMTNLRPVSKIEKVLFPIVVTLLVVLIVPDAAPLVGFLMLGNLFNISGVTDRLSKTAQNELINIVTICLGVSVGATANAQNFLKLETLYIIGLGLCAFCVSTCGGLVTGKIMCKLTGGKINPLIGSAGVSAVPMAARVAQDEGRKADPSNFLLMHAMGPNVAGVIGSAVAAGVFLSFLR
ncbi:MAG: sodium ion-translocating decarboxylase subunit beta [Clostridia bacterium]|nr:sodium ion-translocating decarboxylase subunit beta [Clostridia bacterium]